MFNKGIGIFNHYLDALQNNPDKDLSFGIEKSRDEHVRDFDVDTVDVAVYRDGSFDSAQPEAVKYAING